MSTWKAGARGGQNWKSTTVRVFPLRLGLAVWLCLQVVCVAVLAAESPSADQIVERCTRSDRPHDLVSRVTLRVTNAGGEETKHRQYIHLWKRYPEAGADDVVEKMALFTVEPSSFREVNYLRWDYDFDTGKPAEQWLYHYKLPKVRRMSMADPRDLSWGIIGEDLHFRDPEQDRHELTEEISYGLEKVYVVTSYPKNDRSRYGRMVNRYLWQGSWSKCYPEQITFFDKKGNQLKRAELEWERVDGVYTTRRIAIFGEKPTIRTEYLSSSIRVNVGLDEQYFTTRFLSRPAPIQLLESSD